MASLFQLVNQLAELSVGRRPRWQIQDSTEGVPTTATAGASMQSAVVNRLQISLRQNLGFKTTRLEQNYAGETTATITITIDDNDVVVSLDGIARENELAELADGINGDATVSEIVTAAVEDDQLVITGDGSGDYTIAVTDDETGDRIEIAHEDASTADARIFRLPGGTSTDRPDWGVHESLENLDFRGAQIAVPVAGYRRCYVEIDNADGDVIVTQGPCVSE